MSRFLFLTLKGPYLEEHYFNTYEEAEESAKKFNFDITIYEATARVSIEHSVERLGGDA